MLGMSRADMTTRAGDTVYGFNSTADRAVFDFSTNDVPIVTIWDAAGIGVLEEHRGSGLHAKLVVDVIEGARRAGYERIDASVIDERNKPMRGVVEGAGMDVYRRFRFFERPVR